MVNLLTQIGEKLKAIVGDENFSSAPQALKQYSCDYSLVPPKMPSYLVRPKSAEEIVSILKLANEFKMPVTPFSSGVHFYGTTIPSYGGIALDLRRMNSILRIDERNRCAMFQAGVTWGQLQEELAKHELMALNPLCPHATKSALTSHLEREPMLIPKFEYSDPILAMEVVLPTGEILRTGSASTPGALDPDALTSLCCPFGPGMDFYRLFQGAQGTLGIVTWINVKVEYLPKMQELFLIPFESLNDAVENLYLIQRKMIGNECFLLNNLNMANILSEQWPSDFETLRNELPPFILVLVLAGGRRRPEEKIEYEKKTLMKVCPKANMNIISVISPKFKKVLLQRLRKPWPEEIPYWKIRCDGGFEDVFFITTMNKVPKLTRLVNRIAVRNGYPIDKIGFYLQPLERARVAHCEYNFFYNPKDSTDVEKIRRLSKEIIEPLINFGAFFSRPYGHIADVVYSRSGGYAAALKVIKSILDPNNILNPNKLCY